MFNKKEEKQACKYCKYYLSWNNSLPQCEADGEECPQANGMNKNFKCKYFIKR